MVLISLFFCCVLHFLPQNIFLSILALFSFLPLSHPLHSTYIGLVLCTKHFWHSSPQTWSNATAAAWKRHLCMWWRSLKICKFILSWLYRSSHALSSGFCLFFLSSLFLWTLQTQSEDLCVSVCMLLFINFPFSFCFAAWKTLEQPLSRPLPPNHTPPSVATCRRVTPFCAPLINLTPIDNDNEQWKGISAGGSSGGWHLNLLVRGWRWRFPGGWLWL